MSPNVDEGLEGFDAELERLLEGFSADHRAAALLPALRLLQRRQGRVTESGMGRVAQRLGVEPLAVAKVAHFYSLLALRAQGRHVIDVCTNLSCSLRGAESVVAHLEGRLGLRVGQTSADGRVTLREVECLASCGTAPCLQIDGEYLEEATPATLDAALARLD